MPPDRSVQGIGEGVLEKLRQVLVDHASGDVADRLVDNGGCKRPACFGWTLERKLQWPFAVRSTISSYINITRAASRKRGARLGSTYWRKVA
jgi:hypothetical protein